MSLIKLLNRYREVASNPREQGDYFERLVRVWLESAPTQAGQFSRVMSYGDWAHEQGQVRTDSGIDLVAQLADEPDEWVAVQCKFYAHGYRIQKPDLDTFISASARRPFSRRMFIDTTGVDWGKNAVETVDQLDVPVQRIGLLDLEESGIDWAAYSETGKVTITKKTPRLDQLKAVEAVVSGLKEADRGKLIMACGTGKTFTSLQIAQDISGRGGRVLFLVPSLALMSQTIREWSIDSVIALRSFAVCSDVQVGVRKAGADDLADMDVNHLEIPATTNGGRLAAKANRPDRDRMTVVFSTYQSIEAVFEAQTLYGLPEFDLIICDEAHRTTGATLAGEDESNFVRIHNAEYISGRKRLYMTATPRVFGEQVQRAAQEGAATLASMDDEATYGKNLFTRNFGWAVQNGLLTDYKVVVLAVDEDSIARGVQRLLADASNELDLDDATRMVGCYKALTKFDFSPDVSTDTGVMRRALMFAKSIKASKLIRDQFGSVATQWRESLDDDVAAAMPALECEARHVDGTMQANTKNEHLAWLKEDAGEDRCRILTNARCLTEGVDVPALDAIMFMHPRKSQIDVVQAVGRVMRRSPGKKLGYVILPIGVPAGVTPEQALNDNERYKVVWQILNALRSHDERLDADINKIDLGVASDRIEIIAVSDTLPSRAERKNERADIGKGGGAENDDDRNRDTTRDRPDEYRGNLSFEFSEYSKAIMAKIVKKCGTRTYWEDWASDVAKIAQRHIARIKAAVEAADSEAQSAFHAFLAEIRDDLNDAVTADEAIEMLAQHLITRPVFDALFEDYAFAEENPVSRALEGVLEALDKQGLEKEAKSLERFYASVRTRAAGITDARAKQKIVVELYDKFFKSAFPKLTQRMGIVYTPVEVVDFIIHSVEEVLKEEFGQSISDEGVHVIDPFTGTGTFITRLLQSGVIKREDMARKFAREIHANEIILLAYYIAAINIEAVYYDLVGEEAGGYTSFPGICLTDTFQMYEKDDLISGLLADNSDRRNRQKTLPIKVIIGNPPYSAGQGSANDNAGNVAYAGLNQRIAETYAARSSATAKQKLYDSYIRAIRWGSDRLKDHGGVLAFVTNAGWLDASTTDGLRKCLAEEFTRIDVFHLRGNQRTQGEQSRREGGKIFGQGSRTPVAISLMTLNPNRDERGAIRFHDIGDYLSREDKLARVARFGSLAGITAANGWQAIKPDEHGDWLDQRDSSFDAFIAMGNKSGKESEPALFDLFSLGVATNRDAWAINSSKASVLRNIQSMINVYEGERARFAALNRTFDTAKARNAFLDGFVDNDPKRISWSRGLKADLGRGVSIAVDPAKLVPVVYRPFSPAWMYFDSVLNEEPGKMPRLFPATGLENRLICVPGRCGKDQFSGLLVAALPDLNLAPGMGGYQSFPRYIYEPVTLDTRDSNMGDLFAADPAASDGDTPQYVRRDAITDEGLAHFHAAYPGEAVSKDDIFDYVYGVLHHPTYRERYADNLTKELPRIPLMTRAADFSAMVKAGRELGRLHVDYDTMEPWPVTIAEGDLRLANIPDPVSFYRVEKMKFAKRTDERGKKVDDRTSVIYNPRITITNIPLEAWDYVVNGKPALAWVMERQCVKTDPASGIVSDANAYANESLDDPRYPLDLFCRVITVSMETNRIVAGLPEFDIREGGQLEGNGGIEGLKRAIEEKWDGTPAGDLALRIVEGVAARGPSISDKLRVPDFLQFLEVPELTEDLVGALSILTQSRLAILSVGGEWICDDGSTVELSSENFQRALAGNSIIPPGSTTEHSDAADRVAPFFRVKAEILGPQS